MNKASCISNHELLGVGVSVPDFFICVEWGYFRSNSWAFLLCDNLIVEVEKKTSCAHMLQVKLHNNSTIEICDDVLLEKI